MGYRTEMYLSFVKSLLGPKDGLYEALNNDPRDEYGSGILEPKNYNRGNIEDYSISDLKDVAEKPLNSDEIFEPDDSTEEDLDQIGADSSLDPKALPKNLGISFVAEAESDPKLNICITWARYKEENKVWKRKPSYKIINGYELKKGDERLALDKGVTLFIKIMELNKNRWHVSIYLVNTSEDYKDSPKTHDMIFQPQIRIKAFDTVKVVSLWKRYAESENEKELSFLYRNLTALARGHMCSAVWQEIDPERPFEGETNILISPDMELLNENEKRMFICPTVRTEYLPAYAITQSPLEALNIENMQKGDMNAGKLSETWEPNYVINVLERLTGAYGNWISKQEEQLEGLTEEDRKIGVKTLSECQKSLDRMKEGINILKQNENAMLAFYFMNRVMETQHSWKKSDKSTNKKPELEWRPFQIAFILQSIPSIVNINHKDRELCDLLWFPTGGGKTEAYLGLIVFTLAYTRRDSEFWEKKGLSVNGTLVISRYTLRLLTIQQFRRALNAITACELLRTTKWHPTGYELGKNMWGKRMFSIGLWIGGNVTPNRIDERLTWDTNRRMRIRITGAAGNLMHNNQNQNVRERVESEGEPAQVLNCPVCDSILAIPTKNKEMSDFSTKSEYTIYLSINSAKPFSLDKTKLSTDRFIVTEIKQYQLQGNEFFTLEIKIKALDGDFTDLGIDDWCNSKIITTDIQLLCASASRPGYFIRRSTDVNRRPIDVEIRCPNPTCELNQHDWNEFEDTSEEGKEILEPFRLQNNKSKGIPIPAFTVDSQIYSYCPSVVLGTADKFARMPFEPYCASIFGNVDLYDKNFGYYRTNVPPDTGGGFPKPKQLKGKPIKRFVPPQLIIQDELHLIEGPLGSIYGMYEIAIDEMSTLVFDSVVVKPKYIASTATIKEASSQILSLYNRNLSQFPAIGINALDNFFSIVKELHPLDDKPSGRLYVGICAPGKGPQSTIRDVWTPLLQKGEELKRNSGGKVDQELDRFMTIVGYFNAVRELAEVQSLYRQDIPERIKARYGDPNARILGFPIELSSGIDSLELPAFIDELSRFPNNKVDALLTTSMFGVGIDIDRLNMMIVHGQPKTTASYIQATGRVGRRTGGLIITFLRSTRPRDLDHYEFFVGYHRALHKHVEPMTVAPFSIRSIERTLGAVFVGTIRNANSVRGVPVDRNWIANGSDSASNIGPRRMYLNAGSTEIKILTDLIISRSQSQPFGRIQSRDVIKNMIDSGIQNWSNTARVENELAYYESTFISSTPKKPVVLGDEQHKKANKKRIFENVLQSFRDIEQTTRFQG